MEVSLKTQWKRMLLNFWLLNLTAFFTGFTRMPVCQPKPEESLVAAFWKVGCKCKISVWWVVTLINKGYWFARKSHPVSVIYSYSKSVKTASTKELSVHIFYRTEGGFIHLIFNSWFALHNESKAFTGIVIQIRKFILKGKGYHDDTLFLNNLFLVL